MDHLERSVGRRLIGGVLIAVGTAVTEGPAGAFIRGWTPPVARVAWIALLAAALGLAYGIVATAGRPASRVFLWMLGLHALVLVFVQLVRAEVRCERELRALRAPKRRPASSAS